MTIDNSFVGLSPEAPKTPQLDSAGGAVGPRRYGRALYRRLRTDLGRRPGCGHCADRPGPRARSESGSGLAPERLGATTAGKDRAYGARDAPVEPHTDRIADKWRVTRAADVAQLRHVKRHSPIPKPLNPIFRLIRAAHNQIQSHAAPCAAKSLGCCLARLQLLPGAGVREMAEFSSAARWSDGAGALELSMVHQPARRRIEGVAAVLSHLTWSAPMNLAVGDGA